MYPVALVSKLVELSGSSCIERQAGGRIPSTVRGQASWTAGCPLPCCRKARRGASTPICHGARPCGSAPILTVRAKHRASRGAGMIPKNPLLPVQGRGGPNYPHPGAAELNAPRPNLTVISLLVAHNPTVFARLIRERLWLRVSGGSWKLLPLYRSGQRRQRRATGGEFCHPLLTADNSIHPKLTVPAWYAALEDRTCFGHSWSGTPSGYSGPGSGAVGENPHGGSQC
jgi:hypothetical protein